MGLPILQKLLMLMLQLLLILMMHLLRRVKLFLKRLLRERWLKILKIQKNLREKKKPLLKVKKESLLLKVKVKLKNHLKRLLKREEMNQPRKLMKLMKWKGSWQHEDKLRQDKNILIFAFNFKFHKDIMSKELLEMIAMHWP